MAEQSNPPQTEAQAEFQKLKASFTPLSLTRNGVSLSFTLQREEKGPSADKDLYLFPDTITDSEGNVTPNPVFTLENLVNLIGEDTVIKKLIIQFKKGMKEVYNDNLDANNGQLNLKTISQEIADYQFKAVSLAAINEALNKEFAIMQAMLMSANTPEEMAKVKEFLATKVAPLQKAKAKKERKSSVGDEEEEEQPVVA